MGSSQVYGGIALPRGVCFVRCGSVARLAPSFVLFDNLLGQQEVVFRSGRFRIVEDGGQSVARSLAKFDVALDDRFKHEFLEVALHFVVDLIGQTQTLVVHGQ